VRARAAAAWWRWLSYVPGTKPHRTYHRAVAWVVESAEHLERAWGRPFPEFPMPLPRHRDALYVAINTIMPFLRAGASLQRGAEPLEVWAVIDEHMPEWGRRGWHSSEQ